ncbi:hypothetical protein [Alteriqipengyuania lutimaris]|uniref:hypothetical protein n=1 Tax=Alteriqipengyuania lutimaris TaxID=1538146 RepID=UPI001CFCEAC9|nr:hypothetical protein [Alteriqipengyuania lutimaris]
MLGSKAEKPNAMRYDCEEEPEPLYDGPFVVIEPEGIGYRVETRPVLPTGEGSPFTYGSKHEAFGAARDLWTAHRLPVLDLTDARRGARREE